MWLNLVVWSEPNVCELGGFRVVKILFFSLPLKYYYSYWLVLYFIAYKLEGILCVFVYTNICEYRYVNEIVTHIQFFLFQVFIAVRIVMLTQLCLLTFARLLYDMVVCRRSAYIISEFLRYLSAYLLPVRGPSGDLTNFSRNAGTDSVARSYTENRTVFPLTRTGKVTALPLSPFCSADWKWSINTYVRWFFIVYLDSCKCGIFLESRFQVNKCEEYFTVVLSTVL